MYEMDDKVCYIICVGYSIIKNICSGHPINDGNHVENDLHLCFHCSMNLEPVCLEYCGKCPSGTYAPICGSDGVTYITPCHAGCTEYTEETSDNGQETTIVVGTHDMF